MRKLSTIIIPAVVAGLLAATMPAGAANAARVRPVPPQLFGQHIAGITQGAPATLTRVGSVRLWDARVTWAELEPEKGKIKFDILEKAIANIESRYPGAEIIYTLGSPPQWAARVKNSPYALYTPGSNSHPTNNADYTNFLLNIATYFGPRIDAYQVWNEANLRDFYLGTPTELAQLTKDARAALNDANRQRGMNAQLVAASVTVRASGPVGKFGRAYGAAMRKARAWSAVNAVSAHFYPPANKGPAERVKYIKKMKKYYKKYGAGNKPLWDTEMNYGDTRRYMKLKRTYKGDTARTYVARTFIDSMRYGVSRVSWYGWDIHMLGTDMTARDLTEGVDIGQVTPGGKAFLEIQDWMAGELWYGCKVKSSVTTCTIGSPTGKATIRYSVKKKTVTLPKGTNWTISKLDGSKGVVSGGSKITLTAQPIHIARP